MEAKSILITGGGGFLGSHLAEHFLLQQKNVVCVDNFSTGLPSNKDFLLGLPGANERLRFIVADVVQPWSQWSGDIKNISHVFHFASPASPPHYQRLAMETMWVNTLGLREALDFSDQQRARLIFASTSEIYGDPEFSPQPESYWGNVNTLGPRSCYDEAKRFGETLVYNHNLKHKTCHGMVRIFNTYGPRMNPNDGRVIINFLMQALRGEALSVYGKGDQNRSFCYVDDLVSGISRYAQLEETAAVNIGNGKVFTILELAQTIQEIFSDKNLKLEFFDLPQDDPKQRCPDLARAHLLLNPWTAKVGLREGLVKMLAWLKSQNLEFIKMAGRPQ